MSLTIKTILAYLSPFSYDVGSPFSLLRNANSVHSLQLHALIVGMSQSERALSCQCVCIKEFNQKHTSWSAPDCLTSEFPSKEAVTIATKVSLPVVEVRIFKLTWKRAFSVFNNWCLCFALAFKEWQIMVDEVVEAMMRRSGGGQWQVGTVEKNDRGYPGGETISRQFKRDVIRLVNLPSGRGVV